MPSGIMLSSGSKGATQEDIAKVMEANGFEVEKPEETAGNEPPAEPKRDDFESDEEFEAAHVEWQDKQPAAQEEDEEEEEQKPAPKKPSRLARKIERATSALKNENADLRKRLEALEKGGKKDEKETPADPNPRPVRGNFKTQEEYEDALLAWGVEKRTAEKAVEDAKKAEQAQLQANWDGYKSAVEEFKDEHDDWDEVVNQNIPMHVSVQLAVMEQENGPAVIYYLGKHPEYAKKLAAQPPLSAVMEVGRLSERLKTGARATSEANGGANPKPRPKVPAPVRPVDTSATSSSLTSRDAKTYKDFKKAQRAGR